MGFSYASLLHDLNKQVYTITFAWAEVALLTAQELNAGSIAGIFSAVNTCASPPPMSLERIVHDVLVPIESNPFVMPIYCIVRDCDHHNPNKQHTFGSVHDRSYHWNKYHRDILGCLLEADPSYLTFLGLMKYPIV